MRHVVTTVVLVGSVVAGLVAQAGTGEESRPSACSLLSKSEVKRLAGGRYPLFDQTAPEEEEVSGRGSACTYAGITIQVDPFAPARLEELRKTIGARWLAVPGVGESAYFRDNPSGYAEVFARSDRHVVTVQLDVPDDVTAESLRPEAAALARALLAKLP